FLDLSLVILLEFLGLLFPESTLQMVDALPSNAELLVDVILLPLELSKLHSTQVTAVKVLQVRHINVNSIGPDLEVGNLLLKLFLPDAITLCLKATFLPLLLFGSQPAVLGFLKRLFLLTLPLCELLF